MVAEKNMSLNTASANFRVSENQLEVTCEMH